MIKGTVLWPVQYILRHKSRTLLGPLLVSVFLRFEVADTSWSLSSDDAGLALQVNLQP